MHYLLADLAAHVHIPAHIVLCLCLCAHTHVHAGGGGGPIVSGIIKTGNRITGPLSQDYCELSVILGSSGIEVASA